MVSALDSGLRDACPSPGPSVSLHAGVIWVPAQLSGKPGEMLEGAHPSP